ncbi:DUF2178 domain-containing protein [Gracilibacillus phocaeensis]|uniref:DUF2178 domain-containing protein n=1 Tax=Gracilibacillus phocaeensis TaxID=2042304 RepID=UPI001A92064D|nr:DUF2178 domain-containing protein [Gracilibacillus phocaeensis]
MNTTDEITDTIFKPLNDWAQAAPGNWNTLLGSGFVVLLAGLILLFGLLRKIGKPDERTNQIHLKSAYIVLLGVVVCDIIFPKEYMWEIFFLFKYGLAFVAAGIYLAVRYKKDFT